MYCLIIITWQDQHCLVLSWTAWLLHCSTAVFGRNYDRDRLPQAGARREMCICKNKNPNFGGWEACHKSSRSGQQARGRAKDAARLLRGIRILRIPGAEPGRNRFGHLFSSAFSSLELFFLPMGSRPWTKARASTHILHRHLFLLFFSCVLSLLPPIAQPFSFVWPPSRGFNF